MTHGKQTGFMICRPRTNMALLRELDRLEREGAFLAEKIRELKIDLQAIREGNAEMGQAKV